MRTLASFCWFPCASSVSKDDPKRVEIVEDASKEAAQPSAEGYEKSVRVH